ncbi:MAG: LVIVD repeat-containing protein, partial [Thermoanaerobaculia bacterium]
AHNGSLIPIPGRDIMVQGWYQGGVSVFDWTDVKHPREIAYFDRGPIDSTRLTLGGSWSAYWYNGLIYNSEIVRGLDIFDLTPSAFLSQNEIDAAKTVKFDYLNVQGQQKFAWPPSFALARAYVDQLARGNELSAARVASLRSTLTSAESANGARRRSALTAAATKLNSEAASSKNAAKVRMLAETMRELARGS